MTCRRSAEIKLYFFRYHEDQERTEGRVQADEVPNGCVPGAQPDER